MNALPNGTIRSRFDVFGLKDSELTVAMKVTMNQLALLKASDEGMIRFWGDIFVLLDEERRRRTLEIAELNRMYFG